MDKGIWFWLFMVLCALAGAGRSWRGAQHPWVGTASGLFFWVALALVGWKVFGDIVQ